MESKLKTTLEALVKRVEVSPPSSLLNSKAMINMILQDLGYLEVTQKYWNEQGLVFGVPTHNEKIGVLVHMWRDLDNCQNALINLNKLKKIHPRSAGIVSDGINFIILIDQEGDGVFRDDQSRKFSINDIDVATNHFSKLSFAGFDFDDLRQKFLFEDPVYAAKDFIKGLMKGEHGKVREFLSWRSPGIQITDIEKMSRELSSEIINYDWARHIEFDDDVMKSFQIIKKILKSRGLSVDDMDMKKTQGYARVTLTDSAYTSAYRIVQSKKDGTLMRLETFKGKQQDESSDFGTVEQNFTIKRPEDLYALSEKIVEAYKMRADLIRLEGEK